MVFECRNVQSSFWVVWVKKEGGWSATGWDSFSAWIYSWSSDDKQEGCGERKQQSDLISPVELQENKEVGCMKIHVLLFRLIGNPLVTLTSFFFFHKVAVQEPNVRVAATKQLVDFTDVNSIKCKFMNWIFFPPWLVSIHPVSRTRSAVCQCNTDCMMINQHVSLPPVYWSPLYTTQW